MSPLRVVFFGTHPCCYNGYCIITYNLAKELSKYEDIELTIWGFQNFGINHQHIKERQVPSNIFLYDAFANENPKSMGFGFDQVTEFITMHEPDVVVLYNDMVVVSNILEKLKAVPNKNFKIIVYIDQVYLHQKPEHINKLNTEADFVLCFTSYWEEIAKYIGINKPTNFLQHGFDPMVNYPVARFLARQHYSLKKEDFIVLNLNRNQPRKRWDLCLMAFAEVVSKHRDEPIKLLIATAVQGAWNLFEVYERELRKRGITLDEGMKHIILIDNPQQLSDHDVNILYNLADIGINTCDGEGFGLCNFQQAAIGIPQIVPNIGGFKDFFNKDRAFVIEPKYTLYIDSSRDGVGGESELCHWKDYADAIEYLYANPDEMKRLGTNAREYIIKNYKWKDIAKKFYDIVCNVCNFDSGGKSDVKSDTQENNIPLSLISQWENELKNMYTVKTNTGEEKEEDINTSASIETTTDFTFDKVVEKPEVSEKKKNKKNKSTKQELLELKAQLERLLAVDEDEED